MSANLVLNPDFNVNLNGWTLDPGNTSSFQRDTTVKFEGAASMRFDSAGDSAPTDGVYYGDRASPQYPAIAAIPGRVCLWSAYVLGSAVLRLRVSELNASNNPALDWTGSNFQSSATVWQQMQLNFTPSAAAAYGLRPRVELGNQLQAVTIHIDAVAFYIYDPADAAPRPLTGRGASW